ncbi:TOBE domain-containing protein [Sulfurimonas sp. HSL-1716]|uniref:TOBE domain-containing protein n=1 Tax=Hydrocurvibacter sulfurireducens TaxID=3131937 RepID=UPI0031F79E06
MNMIDAAVTDIKKHENISAVYFDANGVKLSMVALELDPAIGPGIKVKLKVKATNIALSKGLNSQTSIANQLKTVVQDVVHGQILCSVKLDMQGVILESIITQNSASAMGIKAGDELIALIKSNDVSIASFEEEH